MRRAVTTLLLALATVSPLAVVRTSAGRMARPPGMFSAVGITPMTRIGALSSAIARIALRQKLIGERMVG